MTNRRDFLKQTSMLVAAGFAGSSILSGCGGATTPKKHIGLQLYSLREDVKELGITEVLKIVAKMGYVNLETAGYNDGLIYNIKPSEFKKMVDDLGMKVTSAHIGHDPSDDSDADMSWWGKAIEAHASAGIKYMVMPWSNLDRDDLSLDDVKKYASYFNTIGVKTAGSSIAFGYHNHDFEFKRKIDDVPVYDLLIENTRPQHVFFQNDVYWTQVGGYSPVDYLKKYPDRIKLLHIKDVRDIGGSGTMDFKAIFDQAYANGNIKDWYVEMEDETTPQEDVKKSYDFLAAAEYVK
jgi:sugar phosphate isomerase/epimerase